MLTSHGMLSTSCFGLVSALIGAAAMAARAAVIDVASLAELQTALSKAAPGDEIYLANGVYTSGGKISVARQGTADKPIVVSAKTIGGAEIKGAGGFTFASPAAYVTVRGFKLTHAAGTVSMPVGTHHCRITRNVFQLTGNAYLSYLSVSGDDHQIDYNIFQHKNFVGQMITIQGPGGSEMAQRTWIHHNHFHDFPPCGENNCSAIQVGLSGRSLSPAHSLIEYNLFTQARGENENICNKSCDNIYRYNTFTDNSSEMSLRHGNRMQVYGNFFIGTEGLRIFGDEHQIHSNYFTKCHPAVHVGNGDGVVPGDALTSHDRPDKVQVVFNTLVDNPTNFTMAGRSGGLGATYLTLANNLVQGGNAATTFGGPVSNPKYEGNIVWGNSGGGGGMAASGFTTVNPQLAADPLCGHRLQSGSPAIGKAVGAYAFVGVDMDGQARGAVLDVGADQYGGDRPLNRILTPADVGPNAVEGQVGVLGRGRRDPAFPRVLKHTGAVSLLNPMAGRNYSVFDLSGRRPSLGARKNDAAEGFYLLLRTGLDAN